MRFIECPLCHKIPCSRAAAQRLGLSFEEVFRQAAVYKGRNRDTAWYAAIDSELNTFVGADIADPDTVVPDYTRMRLLAQRTAGGKVKLF